MVENSVGSAVGLLMIRAAVTRTAPASTLARDCNCSSLASALGRVPDTPFSASVTLRARFLPQPNISSCATSGDLGRLAKESQGQPIEFFLRQDEIIKSSQL